MKIFPAVHYTMGGLWVDYNLMTNIPGLYAIGEANFSDHGANRLGASALMQGLADGYFVLPYTIGDYIAQLPFSPISDDAPEFDQAIRVVNERLDKMLSIQGNLTVDEIHRRLGKIMWDKVGMSRSEQGLKQAISEIHDLRKSFWSDVKIPGKKNDINESLEKAGRVADLLELGELMAVDALDRRKVAADTLEKKVKPKKVKPSVTIRITRM